jgi:hypothetical protein
MDQSNVADGIVPEFSTDTHAKQLAVYPLSVIGCVEETSHFSVMRHQYSRVLKIFAVWSYLVCNQ